MPARKKPAAVHEPTVGAYEAKTHLPALLDRVAAGETITITRRGTPVAVLSAPPFAEVAQRTRAEAAWDALMELKRVRPSDITAREIVRWIREDRTERTRRMVGEP
jgi:prevent-host-death family protein